MIAVLLVFIRLLYVIELFMNVFIRLWNTRNYTRKLLPAGQRERQGSRSSPAVDVFWRCGSTGEPEERRLDVFGQILLK